MDNEEVWGKFLPRLGKGNYNSSLSQMSRSSLGSKDGRLSLSSRGYAGASLKALSLHQQPAVTPPRPSASKNSRLWKTPLPNPKTRTPSSNRKGSSKKNTTSDGKTQTSLDSYFSISTTEKCKPREVGVPLVVDITSESSGDEDNNVLCERNQEKPNVRKSFVTPGVSRVLFPATSTTNNKDCGEVLEESCSCISPNRVRDKENHLSSPSVLPISTKSVNKATEKVSEDVSAFNKEIASKLSIGNAATIGSWQTHRASQQIPIPSTVTVTEREVNNSTVGPSNAPSPVPVASSQLRNLVKSMENQPNVQDSVDKGKKKVNSSDLSQDSRDGKIYHSKVTKRIKVNSKQSMESKCHNSAITKKPFCLPPADVTNLPRGYVSLHKPSLDVKKHQTLHDLVENFTGVTESINFKSSGELWTPGSLSSSSSYDFDTSKEKAANTNGLHAKMNKGVNRKTHGGVLKNKQSRNEKSKRQVAKNSFTYKRMRKDKMKTTQKEIVQHASEVNSVADINGLSTTKSLSRISSVENLSQATTVERECFTNSGGFFQEDEIIERPMGQAFVIKTPSIEYLENYGSPLGENSILIENDRGSDSDESSVLADITDIDIVNSSSQALDQNVQVEVSNKTVDNDSQSFGTFSASTVQADNYRRSLNYGLRGVTLTESEWDKMASHSGLNQVSRVKGINMDIANESLASTPVPSIVRNVTQDNSITTQSEIVRGRQASQDLLTERAASPNEGEEAPFNGTSAAIRQGACQPGESSSRAVMSTYSHGMSSHSKEIRLSSSIAPYDQPQIIQNVSPNKEDCSARLASEQKVRKWISNLNQNPATGGVCFEESSVLPKVKSSNKQGSGLQVGDDVNQNEILKNDRERTLVQNPIIPSPEKAINGNSKSCKIFCHVQVLITSYKKQGDRLEIKTTDCVVESKCCHRTDKFRKTSAIMTAEVFEIPGKQNKQLVCGNSKNQHANNWEDDSKNISVKARAKFGQWGWEEFEIECLDEDHCDTDSSLCDQTFESSMLSIQKVCINLCKCSRSLLIQCFILHDEVDIGGGSVEGSKFRVSLKDYESCWGVPDNPVTLSAVASAEISNLFNNKLASTNSDCVVPNLSGSLSEILHNVNKDTSEAVSGTKCQHCAEGIRKSAPVNSKIRQLRQETGDSSLSDLDDTIATDSSDLEWMTQDRESSKRYAVDQWKPLMQILRAGRKSVGSSSESTIGSSESASLSSSTSSQGTYSDKHHRGRAGYGQGRSRVCPFYKKIEGTRFAVDAFSYGAIPGVTHYFLSHFHSDHYMGLNRNFSSPIYCSSVTAKLVTLKLRVAPNLIRKIDPGQSIKIEGVTVTALDANHCPGSLMLLFQLPGGRTHLHVGDFRAHCAMESYHVFWNFNIDKLYLDTTYCDPMYTFPSQEKAINNVLSIVESALIKDRKTLIVCGSYTIGKEKVFAAITERFKFKVWVPNDKRKVLECVREGLEELANLDKDNPSISEGGAARELSLIGALSMLTMVKEDAQVHVLPLTKVNGESLKSHLFSMRNSAFTNIVAFRPTGWAHGRTKGRSDSNLMLNSPLVKIYEVAYSEHSSFLEMARFVKFIKPVTVVKTVNVGSAAEREAMDVHINSWLREAHSKVPVPNRNAESPNSSQVAAEQREAGEFLPRHMKFGVRRLSTAHGSGFKQLVSDSVRSSSGSTNLTYLVSKQEERTSYQSRLQYGVKKRIGSPLGREMTSKKHHK